MANYNVDISVAIKNTNKLTAFNKQLDKTAKIAEQARKGLGEIGQTAKTNIATLNNLSAALSKAQSEFKDTVLGTKASILAARDLATAERMVNKELKERTLLMNKFRFQGGNTRFKSFSQSANQIQSPNVFTTAQQKSIDRQNRKQGRTPVPFGPQQFIGPLPMQGPMFGPMQGPNPMMTVNNNPRILRNLAASRASREASGFGIRPGTQYERPIGPAFSANLKSQLRHQKKIDKNTGKTAQILSTQAGIANFGATGQTQYSAPIGPSEASFMQKRGIGKGANPRGIFASQGGRTARAKGALQSGLIGGGFPLLFGQGGAGAIAGGLGGALGGALSPGFGFAGSIVATAVTQELQKIVEFRKQVSDLNIEMRSMGISANIGSTQINKLGKSLGVTKEEAIKVLEQFKRFGEASVGLAKFFGGDFALFSGFAQADDVSSTLNAIQQASKDLTIQDQIRVTNLLNQKGAEAAINELIDMRRKKVIKLKQEEQKVRQFDPANPTGQGNINQIINNRKELDKLNVESDESIQNLFQIKEGFTELKFATEEAGFSVVSEVERINKELRKLNNTQFQTVELSRTIGSSFQESFKGIIKGTMSVGDAFRNMFMRIADHFLDMAAQMAAAQIQKGFLGMFGNLLNPFSFGSSFASFGSVGAGTSSMFVGSASASAFLADGGTARAGRSYIVGERGPEMFTPGVTGTVTPNESLGGSTNIVVNVDASGSNVEGDEDEGRALGVALSAAIETELIKQKRPGGLLA